MKRSNRFLTLAEIIRERKHEPEPCVECVSHEMLVHAA